MKIYPLEKLRDVGGILCHGCFDLLHIGHLRYFQWARYQMENVPLIVTLTSDKHFPRHLKGDKKPVFPEDVRAEWISYIEIVDYVAIADEPYAVTGIEIIKPQIYCKGHEAIGLIPVEEEVVKRNGGVVRFMPKETDGGKQIYSSGRILSGELLNGR